MDIQTHRYGDDGMDCSNVVFPQSGYTQTTTLGSDVEVVSFKTTC